jgi:glycosyltransferase involved in cell wall biosynthesis
MKKIDVIFSGTLQNAIGPTGTIKRIIKNREYFLGRGYDITVFTSDDCSNNIKTVNTNDSVKQKNSKAKLKEYLKDLVPKSFILSGLYYYRLYLGNKKLTKYYFNQKRSPDIVVFHNVFPCYQFLKTNKNKEIKTVYFMHSDAVPFKMDLIYNPKLKNSWVEGLLMKTHRYIVDNADKFAFIAKIGKDNFLAANPTIDESKTCLLINGIEDFSSNELSDLKSLIIRKRFKYNLVCTGSILNRKGQAIIVEALNRIDKKILKDIHLTLIGDGPDRVKIEEYVSDNNLIENVTFKGKVKNSEVFKHLAANDIFILMSYNEGLPISIIEGMRSSLAIITTNNSGMPEVVKDGFNGVLLEPDVNQLVEIFNNMDNYDFETMGINSRLRFEKELTFGRMREEYCDMLDSLI